MMRERALEYLERHGEYDLKNSQGFTPSLAHRIDRNTSGIVIFGKNIKNGSYPNIRMLKNDIEDAINFEILKMRTIL